MALPATAPLMLRFRDASGDRLLQVCSGTMLIGRSSSCEVCIKDDTISRNHARIIERNGVFLIEDLDSRNGVQIGNQRITSTELRPGMVIRMGNVSILVDGDPESVFDLQFDHDLPDQGVLESLNIDDLEQQLLGKPGEGGVVADLGVALDLFKNAAETLLTGSSLSEVTQGAIDLALRSLPIDRGFLSLVENDQLIPHATGSREGLGGNRRMQLSRTIARQVLDDHRAVLIRDTGNMDNLSTADSIIQMHILSAMCAPLVVQGEVVGILYVDCIESGKPLEPEHLDLISVLALMVSSALEQSRLHQSVEVEKRRRKELSCRLSPNVVERVLAGESQLGSMEADITVLFADLVGFTAMSEKMAPREVVDLLNELFEELTAEVFLEDGTLDKYIGDALIAFFGAPEQQDDHPARAVRTALGMQNRIREMSAQHPDWPPLSMRIGINSGPAVVGDIGSIQRSDYTVIGDTVNIASRLESQVAKAGDVVIGPATAQSCGHQFLLEEMQETPLKGKRSVVKPWRVLGNKGCD